jgi:hypothetical protein
LPQRAVCAHSNAFPASHHIPLGDGAECWHHPRMRSLVPTYSLLLLLSACEGADNGPSHESGDGAVNAGPLLDARAELDARPENDAQREPARDSAPEPVQDAAVSAPLDAARAEAGALACATPEEEKFSFFMISYAAVRRESGSSDGFGGNLGGISGADAICQRVAEHSSPCQKSKVWRAFLSTTKEHAIERIGKGPWHDRLGRLLANSLADLAQERPAGAHALIVNDFPNEDGVPNRNPDGTGNVDNHQTLTGSGVDGKLYMQVGSSRGNACGPSGETWTAEKATCWDWTSAEPAGCPRVGHSWPRQGSGLHWISVGNEGGCAPGATLEERGGLDGTRRVGSAGGYGGFYCFAVTP